ncbi:MAG: biotin--[acetyl-CoA-carboxylase] ligase [Candidatus Hydrogenedentota bacterium]
MNRRGTKSVWHAHKIASFDTERILKETWVRHVDYQPEMPSTNTRAMELASDSSIDLPAIVLTDRQTAGRGRGKNSWWSAEGAITFSLLLDLATGPQRTELWPRLALAAATALCESLEYFAPGLEFGIRWPNDVFCGDRKICGVLPELHLGPMPRVVLGVGLNVNNSIKNAPDDVSARATSLVDLGAHSPNLNDVLIRILQRIEHRLDELLQGGEDLPKLWSSRCLLRGRGIRLRVNSEMIHGHCQGIDSHGALCLHTVRGLERHYGGTIDHVDLANASS